MTPFSRIMRFGKLPGMRSQWRISAGVGLGVAGHAYLNNGRSQSVMHLQDDEGVKVPVYKQLPQYFDIIRRCQRVISCCVSVTLDYQRLFSKSNYSELELSQVHQQSAEKMLDLCRANGGAFIKLGQHASSLTYLLPIEYTLTLAQLQDSCPQSSYEDVQSVILHSTGKSIDQLFDWFSRQPIASASLAQVHKAKLKNSDQIVAVKVQHPQVEYYSDLDIQLVQTVAVIISKVFPDFPFQWLANEMRLNLPKELDFRFEQDNADRLRQYLRQDGESHNMHLPLIHWATERVICMEFVDGLKVFDVAKLKTEGIDTLWLSQTLCRLFAKMTFQYGFVHADAHPGNIMVRKLSNGRQQIVLLDHGLYQELDMDFRERYANLWQSLMSGNEERIKQAAFNLGVDGEAYIVLSCMITARDWESINPQDLLKAKSPVEQALIKTNAGLKATQIVQTLSKIDRRLLLILKANDLTRHICEQLSASSTADFVTAQLDAIWLMRNSKRNRISSVNTPYIKWIENQLLNRVSILLHRIYLVWIKIVVNGLLIIQNLYHRLQSHIVSSSQIELSTN
ncbi:hypothetical protein MP228_003633 [Amoeboaphelidium protococcarum]|nr:hypothetical protein MP228_003633 [Amoeboaphelidium protococcarum]